jgi:hypothetical protein
MFSPPSPPDKESDSSVTMENNSYESDTSSENEGQDFMLFECESIHTPPLVGFKKNYRRRRGKRDGSSVNTLETASYSECSTLNIWSEADDSEEDCLVRRSVSGEIPSPSSPSWGQLRHRHDAVEIEYDRDHTAPLIVYSTTHDNMDGSFSRGKKPVRSKSSKRTFLFLLFLSLFAVVAGLSFIFGTVPVLSSDPKTDENLKRKIHKERANVLEKIRSSRNAVKKFEIVITVPPREYHRNDFLINSLDAHSKCSSVDSVKVLWRGKPNALPNGVIDHESGKVAVVQSKRAHYEKCKTDAILLLNDDVIFSCDEITRGKIVEEI